MTQLYLLLLCLISFGALAQDEYEWPIGGHLTEEQKENAREIEDFLETQNPRVVERIRQSPQAYIKFIEEPLKKIREHRKNCNGVARYSIQRDKEEIIRLFNDNWYWLIATGTEFDPAMFLNTGDKQLRGKSKSDSKIFVYCVQGKPVAFIAYYKVGPHTGKFRFVGNNKYDDKNYEHVEQLVQFAINDLKKMGVYQIELITRLNNVRDIALYKKLGFREIDRFGDDEEHEDRYVELRKSFILEGDV